MASSCRRSCARPVRDALRTPKRSSGGGREAGAVLPFKLILDELGRSPPVVALVGPIPVPVRTLNLMTGRKLRPALPPRAPRSEPVKERVQADPRVAVLVVAPAEEAAAELARLLDRPEAPGELGGGT